jgi:hypothetical protein
VGSLRYRRQVSGWDEIGSDPPAGENEAGGGDYRLTRDPAVDQTQPFGFAAVGLAYNPDPPVVLGAQTSKLNHGSGSRRTKVGRPGCWVTAPFAPHVRDTDHEVRGTLAPGSIRRNVDYAINGIPCASFFSWAANKLGFAVGFEPARKPQSEYLVSSVFLGIRDSLATVVSGTVKAAPGLEPFRGGATVQAGASTGWPVIAPQIPSFGSRVPLRRPRGLVTTETGA